MRYEMNEGWFDLPDGWEDQTINVFSIDAKTGVNLVVSRDIVPAGQSPGDFVRAQVDKLKKELKDYEPLDRRTIDIAGLAANLLEYRWKTNEGVMFQLNAMLVWNQQLLSFTYTAVERFSNEQKQRFVDILQTFELRNPPAENN